ncbi:hypothetical protein RIF29_42000 [Crotalaria pallida]|uniref:Uncharacterized protein n=1 Tax=Crotalaria pallida TaxID=3830 RepID=A0AAN9E651_CROPI
MVTITSSYTIIPNEPTPIGRLALSDNDQVASHSSKPNPQNHGLNMEILHPNEFTKDLTPAVDYTQPIEELPLLLVQVTRFHGNGTNDQGIVIGVSFSHPLCDGLSDIRFVNTWSKMARGGTLDIDELFPSLDRSIIKSPHPPSAPRFDHPELKPFPLMLGSSDNIIEQNKKTVAVTLKLTSEQVEKLKKKANDQSPKEGSRPYSRFEVIAAYIWRCASKARQLDQLQPTRLRYIVDIRNRLNPPLPQNYFGNAYSPTTTPKCYIGDIISKPLSYVAQQIREANDLIQNEYIWSQQDFIMSQEQVGDIRASFQFPGEHKKNSPFYGNPNISIGSWMHLKWYDADFGWGKPMNFGPTVVCPSDKAIIIRSLDDSVIISMHFQEAHMQLFTKFFWEEMLHSKL